MVVDLTDPLKPTVVGEVAAPRFDSPRAIAVQFRYAFVTDAEGSRSSTSRCPTGARLVDRRDAADADAHGIYVARTYAYVAAGSQGPRHRRRRAPRAAEHRPDVQRRRRDERRSRRQARDDQRERVRLRRRRQERPARAAADLGQRDARRVRLQPAADAAADRDATTRTSPALAISKGLDRDRAVDESGNQVAVFGRRGGRPFNLEEMQRMYPAQTATCGTVLRTVPPGPAVAPQPSTCSGRLAPLVPVAPGQLRPSERGAAMSDARETDETARSSWTRPSTCPTSSTC